MIKLTAERKKTALVLLASFSGAYVAFQILSSLMPFRVAFNWTESIPVGLYKQYPLEQNESLQQGALYCFYPKEQAWSKGRNYFPSNLKFCKRVVGVPGDTIAWEQNPSCGTTQFVIHQQTGKIACMGQQRVTDSLKRPVPKGLHVGLIPENNYVFRGDNTIVSLDSRYLGTIARQDIKYKVEPLWTR